MKWFVIIFTLWAPPIFAGDLSAHFSRSEFECKHCHKVIVDPLLIQRLEELREIVGKQIIITSGYRCKEHNRAIGGVLNSQHIRGKAVDIKIPGMTPQEIAKVAKGRFTFIKTYKTWVHVDVR